MAAQATGAGGDGDDISATRVLRASRGGWPGKSARDGHGEPVPLRPGPRPRRPRAPQAALYRIAPHGRIPAPRGRLPELAEGRAGARGPHKLLTPGAEGGRRRARSLEGWGERAGADSGRASRPLSAPSPGRSSAAAARAVRPAGSLLPGRFHRGSARAAAERSFFRQRWPLIARGGHPHPDPRSVALAQPPAPTGRPRSTPGGQLLQLERVAGTGEGGLGARACALPRPGGGPRGGWREEFD